MTLSAWISLSAAVSFQADDQSNVSTADSTRVAEVKRDSVKNDSYVLKDVVVTARESRGPTSVSLIDHAAMEHLQPSSFTDLLELLPGNVTKDPETGKANVIKLREAANASEDNDDYNTSALGTSFVVDGVPINTSADMQASLDASRKSRTVVGKGVDMRTISTDDIENVEIVRGIAGVEYGEMTSGLVKIKRKSGVTRLEARFKADLQSQLFYVGKGFALGNDWVVNAGIDYLDSRMDPRNNRDNFKRVTGSVRLRGEMDTELAEFIWQPSVNLAYTRERDENDPDLTVNNTIDFFRSDNTTMSFNNVLDVKFPVARFFQSAQLTQGLSYGIENMHQDKTVASSRLYPMPVSMTPGPNDVGYLPMLYLAELDVHGRPLTAYLKGSFSGGLTLGGVYNLVKGGVEWNMSKNLGNGRIYDIMRPISEGNTNRPRPFSDVPAMHQVSAYLENTASWDLGSQRFQLMLGLRETQLVHLDSKYALSGKPYLDPRVNLKWTLGSTPTDYGPIGWEVAGGVGQFTKMPVAAYLYPDLLYTDYAQLNYYHNVEAYRVMNVMTFVEDVTNYNLLAARNFKWEVRGDVSFRGNRLSVTYFREDLNDGFRATPTVHTYNYKVYDASGFDPVAADRAPLLSELPYVDEARNAVVSHWTNASRTKKQGVEYTFSSRRIPALSTRVTVSGAWMHTELQNSGALWYKPGVILNGRELQYVGLYDDTEGNTYESFNTNVMIDTSLPRLGLNFSVAVQNMWYTSSQMKFKTGIPTHYMGTDGVVLPFTAECFDDPYLQHLVRTYSSTAFDYRRVPVATTFNIKATKKLWNDRIGIALYVNRLLSIAPDYYLYGSLQRRYSSPYFGMEINLKL